MQVGHPLYYDGGVASALFLILYGVWIGGEVAMLVRSLFRRGAHRRDRGSFAVVIGCVFVGFTLGSGLAAAVPAAAVQAGRYEVYYAGLVVMAMGMALRFSAVIVLGRFFTPVVMIGRDQHVVDTGPYRWIRHPSYTGALLTMAGVLLASTNWLALVGVLPALPGFLYRIRVEEQALAEELGEPYRSYMARTRRLLPFVY
jgi:protein-S-isoprenylcysteine O-methyltransferase Ste14